MPGCGTPSCSIRSGGLLMLLSGKFCLRGRKVEVGDWIELQRPWLQHARGRLWSMKMSCGL